jgi:Tfp pilus assembly protein PilF
MSYFKYGDRAGAKTHLGEALRLEPNFPGAEEARAVLQRL